MDDWRIIKEQENYWKGKSLLQITFPEFWHRAYETGNRFFRYVYDEARRHVELRGIDESYLRGDRCRELWHRHCDFCTKEITTDADETCYCTEDGSDWICSECFEDFKQKFEWKVKGNAQDIPADFVVLHVIVTS